MFQLVMRLEYVKFDVPRPPPGLEGGDLGGRQGDRGPEQTHGVGGSSLRAPAGQQGGSLGSVQQCAGQDRGDAGRGTRGGEGPRERTTDRGGSEVPGAARASGDPFSLLAQGIAQLQSAMSASLATKATELEVVKPGNLRAAQATRAVVHRYRGLATRLGVPDGRHQQRFGYVVAGNPGQLGPLLRRLPQELQLGQVVPPTGGLRGDPDEGGSMEPRGQMGDFDAVSKSP